MDVHCNTFERSYNDIDLCDNSTNSSYIFGSNLFLKLKFNFILPGWKSSWLLRHNLLDLFHDLLNRIMLVVIPEIHGNKCYVNCLCPIFPFAHWTQWTHSQNNWAEYFLGIVAMDIHQLSAPRLKKECILVYIYILLLHY